MKPFAAMRFRKRIDQFLIWVGFSTVTFSNDDMTLRFNNDGTVDLPRGLSSKWLNVKPDTGTAALYEIRWTAAEGDLPGTTSLTQNVWYSLSTSRSFAFIGAQGPSDQTSSFTIAIRLASAGGNGTSAVWRHTITGSG